MEYRYSRRRTQKMEETHMRDADKIFQRLVNEVRDEETRFLRSINYRNDRKKPTYYYTH